MVEIQASKCLVLLSGRNPGFTMCYTIIWSNSGFMVSCTAIWSISKLHNTLLSCFPVDFQASPLVFMIYHYLADSRLHGVFVLLSGRNPGFTVTCWGLNYYPVESGLHNMMEKSRYYPVGPRLHSLNFVRI